VKAKLNLILIINRKNYIVSFVKTYWRYCSAFVISFFCIAALLQKVNSYHVSVPVKFDLSRIPYVDVSIQESCYPMSLDLGSKLELKLLSDHIRGLRKTSLELQTYKNFRGIEYKRSAYCLEKAQIGSFVFNNSTIVEVYPVDEEAYLIYSNRSDKDPPDPVGTIGRGLLKKVNLLLDSKNSKLILSNSFFKLKQDGYDLRKYSKIPFEMTPKGIIVNVSTDLGTFRLLLDTGCTKTILHASKYPGDISKAERRLNLAIKQSKAFSIQGLDYGIFDLYFLQMSEDLNDIDGFLGMDFIENHAMYIDFTKQLIYIEKP